MQVKIELANNFHGIVKDTIKNRTTRSLTVKEAEAIYLLFEKLMIRLEDKGRKYWEKKEELPDRLFKITLDDIIKESKDKLVEENFDSIFEEDWYVGD